MEYYVWSWRCVGGSFEAKAVEQGAGRFAVRGSGVGPTDESAKLAAVANLTEKQKSRAQGWTPSCE